MLQISNSAHKKPAIQISEATSENQLNNVRNLMRAFVDWHRQRHYEDLELIDRYFDKKAFEDELAGLPGKYSPPKGKLLLATYTGEPAGCVALREIEPGICEMKRMFVYPRFQGKGVGRSLATSIIAAARTNGYSIMRLDTSIRQNEALNLYQSLGFEVIEPYYELEADLKNWLVFLELKLAS